MERTAKQHKPNKPDSQYRQRIEQRRERKVLESVILAVMTGEPVPDDLTPDERRLRDLAAAALQRARSDSYTAAELSRALLEMEMLRTVAFLVAVRDNQLYDNVETADGEQTVRIMVDVSERIRAAENIANRGGLPVLTQTAIKTDPEMKMVDIPDHPARESEDQPPPPEVSH